MRSNRDDSLFSRMGITEFRPLEYQRPRTLFRGFGVWFFACAILGVALLSIVGYVAHHFLAKVW